MTDKVLHFTGTIEKTDDEQRMVYGYASTEAVDSQGEIVKKEALKSALEDYMKFANIREMHQPSAVGKAKQAQIDNKGLYIAAKIVDDNAWGKVKEGVYSAFSIGGRVKTMVDNEITGLTLSEISLVDRPANPEATIDVWKAEGMEEVEKRQFTEEERKRMAENGQAMPDGSFPIANEEDLHNAIRAYGRAKNKAAAKKHIIARAKEMGMESALPDDWKTTKGDNPEMKKSIWQADYLVDLACQLSGYVMSEAYEGEDITSLKAALETIKQAAVTELNEEEEYPEISIAVEMAEKAINLKKDDSSSEEHKTEEKKEETSEKETETAEKTEETTQTEEKSSEEESVETKEEKTEETATEENKEEPKETAEKTEMEKIEEGLKAGKMPTDEQCEFLIKEMDEEVNDRTMSVLKYSLAGKILDYITGSMEDNANKDAAMVEAKKAQEAAGVVSETRKHEFDNILLMVSKLEKAMNEQDMNAHTPEDQEKPKASEESPTSPAETVSEALAMLQEAVRILSGQNAGNQRTPKDTANGENGYREGSDGNNGGFVDPDKENPAPAKAGKKNPDGTEAKVDMPDLAKAEMEKLHTELEFVKGELEKLAAQPMPVKVQASYAVIEKTVKTDDAKTELEKAEKRADEIAAEFRKGNSDPALQTEAATLSNTILRLQREVNNQ